MHVVQGVEPAFLHAKPQLVPSVQAWRFRALPPTQRHAKEMVLPVIPTCLIVVLASESRFCCDTTINTSIKSFLVMNRGPDQNLSIRSFQTQPRICGAPVLGPPGK